MPRGAIFLSYAREDEAAAIRLVTGLKSHGCDVWYDRDRLQTGMNYHQELREEVERNCSLFVSVISRNTEAQNEAYFHRERFWASERAVGYPDAVRAEFYHPVVVDDLPLGTARYEPKLFQRFQQTRLEGGAVTPEFATRLAELQRTRRSQN